MDKVRLSPNLLYRLLLSVLIFIFLFLTLGSVVHKALTYDEPQHFRYGELIFNLESDRFDDSKMPISVINVIASKLARLVFGDRYDVWQFMSIGRVSTVLFSLALGILVLTWARSLYGKWIGLVTFGLYVFEPNIIAHSRLITTDIFAAGTITLTLFLFWRFLEETSLRRGLLAALGLGLCQIAKYTGLFLYPLLILLTIIRSWGWITLRLRRRAYRDLWQAILFLFKYGFLFLVVSLLIINLGFLFNRTGTPFGDFNFKSSQFQSINNFSRLVRRIPVPVPYPYLEGLDLVLYHERTGENYGGIYMLGELRPGEGFAGYFLVASLFKVPLPILALFCVSLVDFLKSFRSKEFIKEQVYLLISVLYFSIYFNFFFRSQIGIRFFLVVFPVILIFSAHIFRKWERFSRRTRIVFILSGLYLITSVASYFPHYLSYFNELVLDRSQSYRILADSNLDWGQNRGALTQFLSEHPEYIFEPAEPTTGVVVVGVNKLTGVLGGTETYAWLRENFTPDGHLYYTYLIFDISPSDLNGIME